ncbi:hypothetical protein LBMAG53_12270 [Planctomycetota bacterium]|nr:hypothetical protein LBMAG53_12270 [Planctomycetota bacterium]
MRIRPLGLARLKNMLHFIGGLAATSQRTAGSGEGPAPLGDRSRGRMHGDMRGSALLILTAALHAAEATPDARAGDHAELRELMSRAVGALNSRSVDDLARLLDGTSRLTFIDASVAGSAPAVAETFARWFAPATGLAKVEFAPVVDPGGAVFIGPDVAWATGRSDDRYTLVDGRSGIMPCRWTAVVVRRDGHWRIAAFHAGINVLDNAHLAMRDAAWKAWCWAIGIGAALSGLIAGLLISRMVWRRR